MGTTDEHTNDAALLLEVERLIEAGDYALAEEKLAAVPGEAAPSKELLALKLAVRRESILPAIAMQKLVRLMQENKTLAGAHEFYSEVSKAAYTERISSLAFSHPPPAASKPKS